MPNFLNRIVDKVLILKLKINYDYIRITRALWKNFEIQCHLMTVYPLKYIKKIEYVDIFYTFGHCKKNLY